MRNGHAAYGYECSDAGENPVRFRRTMDGPLAWFLLFGAGVVCGVLNVVAGGESEEHQHREAQERATAGVANATNRVGILFQNVGAVWGFRRAGVLDTGAVLRTPTFAGEP